MKKILAITLLSSIWSCTPEENEVVSDDLDLGIEKQDMDMAFTDDMEEDAEMDAPVSCRRAETTNDLNGDGEYTTLATYSYSDDGKFVEIEFDNGLDGIDSVTKQTLDDDGNILKEEKYRTGETAPNEVYIYVYGNKGKLLSKKWNSTILGEPQEIIYTYDYNSDNNEIKSIETKNGEIRMVITTEYDQDGFIEKKNYDLDGNGNVDWFLAYQTTNEGYIEKEITTNGSYSFFIYENGNLIRREFRTVDDEVNKFVDYEYNEYGFLVKTSTDENADGNYERVNKIAYQCQ